jgi:hypothetical protein
MLVRAGISRSTCPCTTPITAWSGRRAVAPRRVPETAEVAVEVRVVRRVWSALENYYREKVVLVGALRL